MSEETETDSTQVSMGSAILAIGILVPWVFGIALAVGWFNILISIIFPPYAWILTAKWIISLVN